MAKRNSPDEQIILLDINSIWVDRSRRPLDDSLVAALAESMLYVGQLHPVTVRPCSRHFPFRYELLAGFQRLRARERAGFRKIMARIISASDDEAQIVAIDENLFRWELSLDGGETALELRMEAIKKALGKNAPVGKPYLVDKSVYENLQRAWDLASYQERNKFLYLNGLARMRKET